MDRADKIKQIKFNKEMQRKAKERYFEEEFPKAKWFSGVFGRYQCINH